MLKASMRNSSHSTYH